MVRLVRVLQANTTSGHTSGNAVKYHSKTYVHTHTQIQSNIWNYNVIITIIHLKIHFLRAFSQKKKMCAFLFCLTHCNSCVCVTFCLSVCSPSLILLHPVISCWSAIRFNDRINVVDCYQITFVSTAHCLIVNIALCGPGSIVLGVFFSLLFLYINISVMA